MALYEKVELLQTILDDAIQRCVPTYVLKQNNKCPLKNKSLQKDEEGMEGIQGNWRYQVTVTETISVFFNENFAVELCKNNFG